MNKFLLVACALALSSSVYAKQLLENTVMGADTDGWTIWSGDSLTYDYKEGNITPGGAALVTGTVDGVTAIAATCVDVSNWVYFAPFRAEGSVKASSHAAEGATAGIAIQHYSDSDCNYELDFVTETREVVPGEWAQINGDFSLLKETNGIRIVLFATGTTSNGSVWFDDASLTSERQVVEIFDNPDMSENTTGWLLYWGDEIEYNTREGHLTPRGSVRTMGQAARTGVRGPWTGIRSTCVDVSDRAALDQFKVAASARPDSDATEPEMGIHVDYYSEADCRSTFGRSLFFGDAVRGVWSRLEATFVPPEGTKGLIIRVRSTGISEDGGATFDDISLSLTQAVRQLWLIGVGEISNQQIKPFDMRYTRGGALGGEFDPTTIGREIFVSLEVEFEDCNNGQVTYKGEGFKGAYAISRLAENEAVMACQEQGFENMGDRNGWMSGYWFGGAEREGEGFVIDVLSGSGQAVVTWYTYLPTWGVDAPR